MSNQRAKTTMVSGHRPRRRQHVATSVAGLLLALAACETPRHSAPTAPNNSSAAPGANPAPSASGVKGVDCESACVPYLIRGSRQKRLCGVDWRKTGGWPTKACAPYLERLFPPDGCTCPRLPTTSPHPPVFSREPACLDFCSEVFRTDAQLSGVCFVPPNKKSYADPKCDALEEKLYRLSHRRYAECGCESMPRDDWEERPKDEPPTRKR